MKKLLGKNKSTAPKEDKPAFEKPAAPTYVEAWKNEGLELVENDFGVLFIKKERYPYTYKHGNYALGELFDAVNAWETLGIDHPFAATSDETLVFFDTETTGLKGTGTNIFLNGIIEDTGKDFLLTQYVLADPSNEAAFLFESKFWQRQMTVVTYNGKSFDWPQLEMRWTLNREFIPKLRAQRQIDLLHSSKRLWRDDLDGMKLTKVEVEKLGFERVDDMPGHLAPIIYFDAIKSGVATSLMKILKHNEWDLLSLITLYIHSTKLLIESMEESSTTLTNIGKWYGDLKYREISKDTLTQVTSQFEDDEVASAHYYLALQYKREHETNLALKSFEIASQNTSLRMREDSFLHMAILYEHTLKDYDAALTMTIAGMAIAGSEQTSKKEAKAKRIEKWEIRKKRLENKLYFPGNRK